MKQGFPAGKTAKELGIDVSRKFIVLEGNELFDKGETVTLLEDDDTRMPRFINEKGSMRFIHWSGLSYADRTIRDMNVGDILVNREGFENRVLEVGENSFFPQYCRPFNRAVGTWISFEQAELFGWHLKGEGEGISSEIPSGTTVVIGAGKFNGQTGEKTGLHKDNCYIIDLEPHRGYFIPREYCIPTIKEQDGAIAILKAAGRIKEGKILL